MIDDIKNKKEKDIIIIEDTPQGPVYHKFKNNVRIMYGIEELDPAAEGLPILTHRHDKKVFTVMSNSFGFGGTNASLIFSTKKL